MKKDPVCGMDVNVTTPWKIELEKKTYYFCSSQCRDEFLKRKQSERN
jgi:YHS domain-containing protein